LRITVLTADNSLMKMTQARRGPLSSMQVKPDSD
jgi:hypothetical protein